MRGKYSVPGKATHVFLHTRVFDVDICGSALGPCVHHGLDVPQEERPSFRGGCACTHGAFVKTEKGIPCYALLRKTTEGQLA